jgi:hypothetical protein
MRQHGQQVSFSHSLVTLQIFLGLLKLCLSLSEVECLHALWNETILVSFYAVNVTKNYLYWLKQTFMHDVLFEVALHYRYFMSFGIKIGDYIENGFWCSQWFYKSQLIVNIPNKLYMLQVCIVVVGMNVYKVIHPYMKQSVILSLIYNYIKNFKNVYFNFSGPCIIDTRGTNCKVLPTYL